MASSISAGRSGRVCDLPFEAVPGPGDGVLGRLGSTTSTAVIWFMVRVPVLSELMADVNPRVSTEGGP